MIPASVPCQYEYPCAHEREIIAAFRTFYPRYRYADMKRYLFIVRGKRR